MIPRDAVTPARSRLKPRSGDVDDSRVEDPLPAPAQQALKAAYAEYRSAMAGWRAAAKAQDAATGEAAADRLLQARVALYRSLVNSGWGPPPAVRAQLERDAALIEAPEDFDAVLGG